MTGARRVAEAVAAAGRGARLRQLRCTSTGRSSSGEVGPEQPYGRAARPRAPLQDLRRAVPAALRARSGFDLALLRLGIVYGPSPVEHDRPESQTVVDKFRKLAAAGQPLTLDDGGRATIGVVHVEDAARILLESPAVPALEIANVAAETMTVADVGGARPGRAAGGRRRVQLRLAVRLRAPARGLHG